MKESVQGLAIPVARMSMVVELMTGNCYNLPCGTQARLARNLVATVNIAKAKGMDVNEG